MGVQRESGSTKTNPRISYSAKRGCGFAALCASVTKDRRCTLARSLTGKGQPFHPRAGSLVRVLRSLGKRISEGFFHSPIFSKLDDAQIP